MSTAAIIAMRRRKLVRRFRQAGAIDPEHAVALKVIGERHNWVFDRMVRAGVFRSASEGALLHGRGCRDEVPASLPRRGFGRSSHLPALVFGFLAIWNIWQMTCLYRLYQ